MHGDNSQQTQQILLNIQKQIGDLSRETGEQSQILKALTATVSQVHGEVRYTNGRVTKLETETIPAIRKQVAKNGRFINDWKIRLGMIVTGISITWLIVGSWVKRKIGL